MLNIGIRAFIPIAIIIFVVRIFLGLAFDLGGLFTDNKIIALAGIFGFIYILGVVFGKTDIMRDLKWSFRRHPVVLKMLNIFPDRNKKGSMLGNKGKEVLYYISKTMRVRGEITNEMTDRNNFKWYMVHFQSPPTPKTGTTTIEFREDDPNIVFTGRGAADYALYVMSYGGSLGDEQEENK